VIYRKNHDSAEKNENIPYTGSFWQESVIELQAELVDFVFVTPEKRA